MLFLVSSAGLDDDLAVTSLDLAHLDVSVYLGDDSRVGRISCLKEFGYSRKTSGDVTGL